VVRVSVRVIPRAKSASVEMLADGGLKVKVTAPADGGRANAAVLALVADHFGVPKRAVRLLQGATRRQKLLDIDTIS
jgi:uncharacterized protein YggU (UPF0235/DUF167 family)